MDRTRGKVSMKVSVYVSQLFIITLNSGNQHLDSSELEQLGPQMGPARVQS